MTKKLALMFALLLVPSFALAQDEAAVPAAQVEVAATVQEEVPPQPVAASEATPMVGQGCVNCGQSVVGTTISSGCGCGTITTSACGGCGSACGSCGCDAAPTSCCGSRRVRVRRARRSCCAPVSSYCSTPAPSCGCSTPAPSCGCSTPVSTGCGCGSVAAAPVSTGCGCGSSVATSAPVGYVQPVSYVSSDCNSCGQTATLRPFRGSLLRRR